MRYVLLFIGVFCFSIVIGQEREAKRLLDKLNEKYTSYQTLEIDFEMEIDYPEREVVTQRGVLIQDRNKYVFKTPDQEIFGDGKNVWFYLVERNEVQINNYEEDEEGLSVVTPKDLFRQYNSGRFDYAIQMKDKDKTFIEMKPLDDDSEYSKFRLSITSREKKLTDVWAFGKDGSVVRFGIVSLSANKTYPDKTFVFEKSNYPGVFVEDLRID